MKLCGYMAHLFLKDFTKILDFSKNLVRAFFSHPMGFPKWFTLNLETSYLGENSEISEFLKKAKFSIGLTLKCVIRMTLVRPIFHTEFEALQVSSKRFGEIQPYGYGDIGDFCWLLCLFSPKSLVSKFNDVPFRRAHSLGKKWPNQIF